LNLPQRISAFLGPSALDVVKTIIAALLLTFLGLASLFPTHNTHASVSQANKYRSSYGPAETIADLQDTSIKESSGLAASRTTAGIFWTHNDSGDGPFIYAFDHRGRRKGVWRVREAAARDWEDMAAGPGPDRNRNYLYIGDIGDNSERRSEIVVYRVPEPKITPAGASSTNAKPTLTETAESIRLRYPDGPHDAEALLVHPVTGAIYIVIKIMFATVGVYEASAWPGDDGVRTLSRLGELKIPSLFGGMITGGAISPNGRRVALCDYIQAYEIVLTGREPFDSIWKQPLTTIALGNRQQGEAITYRLDGKALLATSEGLPTPLVQVVRR
jgi:hypothetical protein